MLHHLPDRLKYELLSIAIRSNGKIKTEDVEVRLKSLTIDTLYHFHQYKPIWEELKEKLQKFLKEILEDTTSEETFRRSYTRSQINKRISLIMNFILEHLPPCLQRRDTSINVLRLKA